MTICPLCHAQDFGAHRFGLLRCVNCGLVVDRRIFTPQLDRKVNAEAFGEAYEPERSCWVRWFHARNSRRYLRNLRRTGVTGGRLLEVGVGSGSFLREARQAGFEVTGCELSESLARRVQARTGIRVYSQDLASLPAAAFDIVCMHHVLEHVSDPVGLLRAAHGRLVPGGILHLAVPNAACWEAKLPGWNSYEYYHLAYFDQSTLRQALEAAGFAVRYMASHESFSAWFLAFARTVVGRRSMEPPSEVTTSSGRVSPLRRLAEHPYRLTMVASGLVTWPLRWVQGRLGYGDELVAIARSTE